MSATRFHELRQTLGYVRAAKVRLRDGMLADATRYHGYAVQSLAFFRGCQASRPDAVRAVSCTATLHRLVAETGFDIEAAIRVEVAVAPPVDVTALVDLIAEGIDVLRKRGVDIDEDQVVERARNVAASLLGKYELCALDG